MFSIFIIFLKLKLQNKTSHFTTHTCKIITTHSLIALRKLERDFQSDTTITPKQKQLSKQGIGLEQEQQDSELKGTR